MGFVHQPAFPLLTCFPLLFKGKKSSSAPQCEQRQRANYQKPWEASLDPAKSAEHAAGTAGARWLPEREVASVPYSSVPLDCFIIQRINLGVFSRALHGPSLRHGKPKGWCVLLLGCSNKYHMKWLKQQNLYCLTLLEAEVRDQSVGCRLWRRTYSLPLFKLLVVRWQSLASSASTASLHLCLHLHMFSLCECPCPNFSLF